MRILSLFLVPLFLVACVTAETSQILLSTMVNADNEIEKDQTTFRVTDQRFYAHAVIDKIEEPMDVIGTWWYLGRDKKELFKTRILVTPQRPIAKFVLGNKEPWAEGPYRLVIATKEGKILGSKDFVVQGK